MSDDDAATSSANAHDFSGACQVSARLRQVALFVALHVVILLLHKNTFWHCSDICVHLHHSLVAISAFIVLQFQLIFISFSSARLVTHLDDHVVHRLCRPEGRGDQGIQPAEGRRGQPGNQGCCGSHAEQGAGRRGSSGRQGQRR